MASKFFYGLNWNTLLIGKDEGFYIKNVNFVMNNNQTTTEKTLTSKAEHTTELLIVLGMFCLSFGTNVFLDKVMGVNSPKTGLIIYIIAFIIGQGIIAYMNRVSKRYWQFVFFLSSALLLLTVYKYL